LIIRNSLVQTMGRISAKRIDNTKLKNWNTKLGFGNFKNI